MTDTITINMPRSWAEQALDALEYYEHRRIEWDYADEQAITALRAALEHPQVKQASQASAAYDMIDRYLRNSLHDDDYSEYSAALDSLCTHTQNLNCKSTQHRLATLWGYEKSQAEQATDRGITGEAK